jgi:hypothetical protein
MGSAWRLAMNRALMAAIASGLAESLWLVVR